MTFGLATLALGFKEKARGLFLLAAVSGLCFWIVEAEIKSHQINYYNRMSQIEHGCQSGGNPKTSCPKIDWEWVEARNKSAVFKGNNGDKEVAREIESRFKPYIFPHVAVPHVIVIIFGMFFFYRRNFRKWVLVDAS